jgi:aspartate/methionine/tyrosine aminotransferase
MIDISAFGWKSDMAFCEWMAREVGVAAVPGSSFFHEPVNNLIRLHFAKRAETLAAAGERLLKLRSKVGEAGRSSRSTPTSSTAIS